MSALPQSTLHILRAHWIHWLIGLAILVAAVVLSSFVRSILTRLLARIRGFHFGDNSPLARIVHRVRRPVQALVLFTGVGFILPLLDMPAVYLGPMQKALAVLWFIALGWLMISAVYCLEDLLILRFDISVADNLRARRARTQLQLMRRMLITLLIVIDVGLALSVFRDSQIWHYGAGLLASAGLASLVLATAAKSSASNLLAGLQIAFTEPIRLDDVVIVQGEWGRIEEITTTYVVVAIWDQRRLIVPLSYFIENPFQNWTRNTADLLGYPYLYVDYSVPVEPLRQEFRRILEASPDWDKRVCVLQVTNLSEHTMEIRCLLSAADSSRQFNICCEVREKMVTYIQKNYPDAFPRTRFSAVSSGGEKQERLMQPPFAEKT
ncbi:mechanosensitive ion channel family protein [Paracidobacterium acidisoli]|uniref:Mechanosensitive ion channel family protein n=1 Tax=Paracidobacterium acidisoli TaxID=2303751 RepID=A0A372IPE8_9BACT|nr:mechanosensitive ion channel domain-containing protein [Paracidobacterium acidisoli]MBT9330915.1 mechanosensitive ion channel family protein [Paracidobacterium acidisoli]